MCMNSMNVANYTDHQLQQKKVVLTDNDLQIVQ